MVKGKIKWVVWTRIVGCFPVQAFPRCLGRASSAFPRTSTTEERARPLPHHHPVEARHQARASPKGACRPRLGVTGMGFSRIIGEKVERMHEMNRPGPIVISLLLPWTGRAGTFKFEVRPKTP